MKRTAKQIKNLSNAKALKRARELKGLTRKELGLRLNITDRAIEKYENGRDQISVERLSKILCALDIKMDRFLKIKKGKGLKPKDDRQKFVLKNSDRRSYQKIITKECKVLRSMRRVKKISQDEASCLCGYSRPTIGHIENGRIELSKERIGHILESYGCSYFEFEKNLGKEVLRDSIVDDCILKIGELDDKKLDLLKGLLLNL